MSPRKTRRGKPKGENVNESVSIIEDSMRQLESPSTHSRSLRTRRIKEPPKETPKKDSSPSLSVSLRPVRRTRTRKTLADTSTKTIDTPNTDKTSRKSSKRGKTEIINETIFPDEHPELPPKKRVKKKRLPDTQKSIIHSKSITTDEDAEVASVSSKIFQKNPSKSSNRSLRSKNNSPSIVTPESSPITIPLTPHRSTKTPRKSPINLSSPKTHSHSSPKRLSKTPRKLSIISTFPHESSLSPKKLLQSLEKVSPQVSPPKKSPKPVKFLVKTPKIVLRKSKSPKNSKKSTIPSDKVSKTEIANNFNSPQLILKRISSPSSSAIDDPDEKPTPSRPMITSRLHSVIKSEMTSSTPRERAREIRKSLNLSSGDSPLPVSKFYGTGKIPVDESRALFIENETNPLISEDDDSFDISGVKQVDSDEKEANKTRSFHKNSTYELAEPKTPNLRNSSGNKKRSGDDTYDLEEPKTPGLRKRTGKRSLSEMHCDAVDEDEIAPKRMCRVRFATPELKAMESPRETPRLVFRSRSATPSSKLLKKVDSDMRNITKRRRSNSMNEEFMKSTDSVMKKRSLSIAIADTSSQKEVKWSQKAQNESINRLSKPKLSTTLSDTDKKKKPEIKGNSGKKVPNFAEIHQKKFDKMESLVDAKKRVVDRHNTLTSNFSLKIASDANAHDSKIIEKPGKIRKSSDTLDAVKNGGFNRFGFKVQDQGSKVNETGKMKINDEYNRFGFKVRKQEATKIISQPLSVKIQAKKEEKRMALKGVRSNRRFELLMKSRNMQ